MPDIVLISTPYTIKEIPPLSLAVLKGAVEYEGFSAKTIDLGMELFKELDKDLSLFDCYQRYFAEYTLSDDIEARADKFLESWANRLLSYNSKWIGISVFSYNSQLSTYILCSKLKKLNPSVNIVLGGPGIGTPATNNIYDFCQVTASEKIIKFGDFLKKRNLASECIYGDGEQALVTLLQGESIVKDFYAENYKDAPLPFANFDDYSLYDYEGQLGKGYPQLPIFSSKGCVRNCDFCDVASIQQKFRFRTGKNIAEEMIYLANRYNIREFVFLDSLVNGSLKNMKEWMTELANYNRNNPDKRITWSASGWICRPKGQMPESVYTLMAESGCDSVTIGAESGSNNVLKAMAKKTTVEALYYEVDQLQKNNINFIILLIVGHWSESWEDFLETCKLMFNLAKYARQGNFISVNPGLSFDLLSDTPAEHNSATNKLVKKNSKLWWTSLNPDLTFKERIYRVLILEKLINELRIPLMYPIAEILYNRVSADIEDTKNYYSTVTKDYQLNSQAEFHYKNFDKLWESISPVDACADQKTQLTLELEVQTIHKKSPARFEVIWNGDRVIDKYFDEGTYTIDLSLSNRVCNSLDMTFSNKSFDETVVDLQGNIIKDKFIKIKSFFIDNHNISTDPEFFREHLRYTENNQSVVTKDGFWINNSTLGIDFEFPFTRWYCSRSNKNAEFEVYIVENNTPIRSEKIKIDYDEYREKIVKLLSHVRY